MSVIGVTGANGFVGRRTVAALLKDGHQVHAFSRGVMNIPPGANVHQIQNLESERWSDMLSGLNCIIHCAARAHVMDDLREGSLERYWSTNVNGTIALARGAAAAGVKRLVFVSSVKVNGESTDGRPPYTLDDGRFPEDHYGYSKAEAERALLALAKVGALEVSIVRPVLVYGPGVKGNFASLVRLVRRGVPLPLAGIRNRRSFVALDNLVSILKACAFHPSANGRVFFASDGDDISTPELVKRIAEAMGRRARLFAVPDSALKLVATVMRRQSAVSRLTGSLQVDISDTISILGWRPVTNMGDELRRVAEGCR